MIRCYVEPGALKQARITLSAEESRHLVQVLRCKPGQAVTLLDGRGSRATGVLEQVHAKIAHVSIRDVEQYPRRTPELELIFGLPKAQKTDLILQKAVELGVDLIRPVMMARSVVRLDGRQLVNKTERWQAIAVSAVKQCGALWTPDLAPALSLEAALEASGSDPLLVCSLSADAKPLKLVLTGLVKQREHVYVRRIRLAIGPEGDFSPAEQALLKQRSARLVSLGTHTLRTETAVLYALAILNYEWFNSSF